MSRHCNSCGGVLGQDCFNPGECEYITHMMEMQKLEDLRFEIHVRDQHIASLEERIKVLEEALAKAGVKL